MSARIDAVVTHHVNTFASGVARFNEILAQYLGAPLLALRDDGLDRAQRPLLSFKFSELIADLEADLTALVEVSGRDFELFLHEFTDLPLERRLIGAAAFVHAGNAEILERVRDLNPRTDLLWTPGLLMDQRPFRPAAISVFSFGMAHKLQTQRFARLRELLDATARQYVVYVSSANHETASIRDAQVVFEEMHKVFPEELYFTGNLSDVAVFNYLQATTYFSAFFSKGVRANNTSVAAALEQGCVVITNLDEHSPREFIHMDNIIDIDQCSELPSDPFVLKRLSLRAMETARERGWDALVRRLTPPA